MDEKQIKLSKSSVIQITNKTIKRAEGSDFTIYKKITNK